MQGYVISIFFLLLFVGLQGKPHPIAAQLVIGVGDLDAHGFVPLQPGGQDGGPCPAEGVENSPAGDADLHQVPHELQGLLGDVDSVLRVGVAEHPRQTFHRTAKGQGAVAPPDNELALLAEAPLLRAAGQLVPNGAAPPDPPGPLQGVGDGGVLPPVDEQADGGAGLAHPPGVRKPFRHPAGPAALVFLVAVKIRERAFGLEAAVLLVGGAAFLRRFRTPGGIGRVGDEGVKRAWRKGAQQAQGVPMQNGPPLAAGVLDEGQLCVKVCFVVQWQTSFRLGYRSGWERVFFLAGFQPSGGASWALSRSGVRRIFMYASVMQSSSGVGLSKVWPGSTCAPE